MTKATHLRVQNLRRHLKERKVSPEQFAREVGLSHMTIRRWLKKSDSTPIPHKYLPLLEATLRPNGAKVAPLNLMKDLDVEKILKDIEFSGQTVGDVDEIDKDLKEKIRVVKPDPAFLRYLKELVLAAKSKDIPIQAKAIAIGALLYFINPIDLIPDTIPVIGYLDDLAVLSIALGFISKSISSKT